MDRKQVEDLLAAVRAGKASIEQALEQLARLGTGDLGYARLDHHRSFRRGHFEAVFAEGKQAHHVLGIVAHLRDQSRPVLVTRVVDELGRGLAESFPQGIHDPVSRTFRLGLEAPPDSGAPPLLIISAGTADAPVAEEAAVTAEAFGIAVDRLQDVGVAGLHRLTEHLSRIRAASAIIVVAGMEGALPSVVTGLVEAPVIGVPTSVGYGASFGGVAALLGMLNSCAGGLTVVNIDNGFGAACAARAILASRDRNDGSQGPR
jgi:hypothetical protein